MRKLMNGVFVLGLVVPSLAMAQGGDPDKAVAGGGALPAGWDMRVDVKDASKPALPKLVTMGPGLHVTSGTAAIYWMPQNNARGTYTVEGTFTQTKAPTHAEAYGLIFGGRALKSPNQSYGYFLVRQNGMYMVSHRASDTELHSIQKWTEHPAIVKADAAGKATNALAVEVGAENVRFLVNGTEVFTAPKSTFGNVDGFAGLRVNHNLDVHIDKFGVKGGK